VKYRTTLTIPPSVNHCYVRRGKVYFKNGKRKKRMMNVLSPVAEQWMKDARDSNLTALQNSQWECTDDKKVIVDIWVFWPDKRRRDAHNLLKLLCDSLEGFVCKDDKMMLTRIQDFDYDKSNPRVEVEARLYDS
jgi:crossover junction endodeoxyribonuclease RusA